MLDELPGLRTADHSGKFRFAGLTDARYAAKLSEQLLRALPTNAGNVEEFAVKRAPPAAVPVKSDGEAVRFVPDALD